jgi:asparagine synthetase B (glutamine-hydrolysing)
MFGGHGTGYPETNLKRRGPDQYRSVIIDTTTAAETAGMNRTRQHHQPRIHQQIELRASVLQMRQEFMSQPVNLVPQVQLQQNDERGPTTKDRDDDDHQQKHQQEEEDAPPSSSPAATQTEPGAGTYYLCWNGEVYQTLDDEFAWRYDQSDTLQVAQALQKELGLLHCSSSSASSKGKQGNAASSEQPLHTKAVTTATHRSILRTATAIANNVFGPLYNAEYAFVLVTPEAVYYGRDAWGRRSLLLRQCPKPGCASFQIVSTPENDDNDDSLRAQSSSSSDWQEIPPGLVHMMRLTMDAIPSSNHHEHPKQGIIPRTMDSVAIPQLMMPSLTQLLLLPTTPTPSPPPQNVPDDLWRASFGLEYHLRRAVAMRLDQQSPQQRPHFPLPSGSAVLFSGGLDSAVLAALAAQQQAGPVHLYNVSFGTDFAKSADRQAALETRDALLATCCTPTTTLEFRDIAIRDWDIIRQSEEHIRTLLQPKSTLMDLNIATALWFASRGTNSPTADDDRNARENTSNKKEPNPRVLLLGMGADELMGGYGRHRKAFERGGWEKLQAELQMDQARFWERNLGRDDRVCSDHGKEARFPYLDAHVVNYIRSLPLSLICDFELRSGFGDKRILRLVALRLGLDHASGLVKRAIQFGSRISHVSDAKRFGSRRKAKGDSTISAAVDKCA